MKRRTILKTLPALTLLPAALKVTIVEADEHKAAASKAAGAASKKVELPDYAGKLGYSDGSVTNPDGSTQRGFKDRSSKSQNADPKAPYQMPLTEEELGILKGSKGPEMAKIMAIVVAHGNAFGAEGLVDLGGAPHCSLYTGTDYMKPMIDLFQECADAGLKTYAPYTVNPRCYDVYNVNNNETDMRLIYEGYRYSGISIGFMPNSVLRT